MLGELGVSLGPLTDLVVSLDWPWLMIVRKTSNLIGYRRFRYRVGATRYGAYRNLSPVCNAWADFAKGWATALHSFALSKLCAIECAHVRIVKLISLHWFKLRSLLRLIRWNSVHKLKTHKSLVSLWLKVWREHEAIALKRRLCVCNQVLNTKVVI